MHCTYSFTFSMRTYMVLSGNLYIHQLMEMNIFIHRKNEHFSAIAFMPAVSAEADSSNLSEPVAVPKPEVQNRVVYTATELHHINLHSDCSICQCVRKALFSSPVGSLCHTRGVVRRP